MNVYKFSSSVGVQDILLYTEDSFVCEMFVRSENINSSGNITRYYCCSFKDTLFDFGLLFN